MILLVRDEVLVQILAVDHDVVECGPAQHHRSPIDGEHLALGVELSGVDFAFPTCLEAPLARQNEPAESMTLVASPRSRS